MSTPLANQGGKQNSRIYIGRISHNVQSKDLEEIFSKYGNVAEVRMNRNFAFIQYLDEDSAQKAISEENGKLYFGKKLDVQFARAPQNDGPNKPPAESPDTGRDRSPLRGNDRFEPMNCGKFGGGSGMGWGGSRGGNDGRIGFWANETESPRDFMGGMRGGRGGRGGSGGPPFRSPSMQGDRRGDEGMPPQFSPFRQGGGDPLNFGRDNFGGPRGGGPGGPPDQPFRGSDGGGPPPFGRGDMRDPTPPFRGPPGGSGTNDASPFRGPQGGGGSNDTGPFRGPSGGGGGSNDAGPFSRGPPGGGGGGSNEVSPFRGPPGGGGNTDGAPFRGPSETSSWAQQNHPPDSSPFNRSGPPVAGSPFRNTQPDSSRNQLRPPNQQPAILSTPSSERVNDIEIIVINKANTDYGEFIERRLKALGFTVDVLFPNEEVPLGRVLGNIASRGTLYSVVVGNLHQQHRSLTLHILHGLPQEHRNMPVDDALTLISRNFDSYIRQCKEKPGKSAGPPENIRHMIEQVISGKDLTGPQYEKLNQFFTQEKQRVDPIASSMPSDSSSQEAVLQNRILNILNKTGTGVAPEAVSQPSPQTQKVGSAPPLLNDPSVQKALDSLIQGDLLRKIAPQQQVYNRY